MNLSMFFDIVSQRFTTINFIYISSSITNALQISISLKLNDNKLNSAFRDSHFHGNIFYPHTIDEFFAKHINTWTWFVKKVDDEEVVFLRSIHFPNREDELFLNFFFWGPINSRRIIYKYHRSISHCFKCCLKGGPPIDRYHVEP